MISSREIVLLNYRLNYFYKINSSKEVLEKESVYPMEEMSDNNVQDHANINMLSKPLEAGYTV